MSGKPADEKEGQVKFCHERAVHIQKHYGAFCETLGSITRKIARLRDKGDILSKQVLEFVEKEKISHSTSKNLKDFAHSIAAIQDYRDAEIVRLENKVIKPLSAYGPKCKKIKKIVKTEQGAIKKEMKQRKSLEKVRLKRPGDAHYISASTQAETELQKAVSDASIGSQALHKHMTLFETEKLTDLKRILVDFVSIEMAFHAKAIEHYSQCFESLAMVDEEMDFEEFTRKLNQSRGLVPVMLPLETDLPLGTMTSTNISSTLGSSSEYTSTGGSYTYTYGDSTMSSGEKRVRIQAAGKSMYVDDDDDDDDDSDHDDDEDDNNGYSRAVRQ